MGSEFLRRAMLAAASLVLAVGASSRAVAEIDPSRLEVQPACQGGGGAPLHTGETLRVLTVNLAHGRKDGLNQMLQSGEVARRNVEEAAGVLKAIDAHVIALQEADAPSRWSGQFDHVRAVADHAGYDCRHHGVHAETRMYAFGTALLSRFRYQRTLVHDFPPTPPTTRKGFVAAQIHWSPNGGEAPPLTVTLVSVHLDFSRRASRRTQFEDLERILDVMPRPLIVMGDFNTDWFGREQLLSGFAERLGLIAWRPEAQGLGTYGDDDKRLDWVLASADLEFVDYRTLDDEVSDHRPVLAEFELARPAQARSITAPVQ